MKQTKLWLAMIVALLYSLTASAHDFEVDGIYYKITNSTDLTVAVTYQGSSYSSYSNEYSGAVTIPSTVTYNSKTYNVKSIGAYAFRDCSSLTTIAIPEGVTSIGEKAFYVCKNLTSITFPESVTSIGDYAFYACISLSSITLPKGITSIGNCAFNSCSSLTDIHIESIELWLEIENVGYKFSPNYYLYIDDILLTEVEIPSTITSISYAFYGCSSITSIIIPEVSKLTSIGNYAFYGCNSLTSITIPEGVTSIGNYAFYNSKELKDITLPSNLISMGTNAFYGCTGLTKIVSKIEEPWAITAFPSTVMKNAILVVPQGSKSKYETIDGWNNFLIYGDEETIYLKKHTDNQGVLYKLEQDSVGFYYCVSGYDAENLLSDVSIPEDIQGCAVRKIYAFNGAEKLCSVTLPTSLNYIGNNAFKDCSNLKRVYSLLEKPIPISSSATFPWSNAVLIVPKGSRADYKCASYWKSAMIFEEGDTVYEKIYTDAQGVKYTLNEKEDKYYYSVTGNSGLLSTEVVIPTDIDGCPVTAIASSAFANCTELEKVLLPESLTSLYVNAFVGCTSLKEIVSRIQDPSQLSVKEIKQEVYERSILRIPEGTKTAYLNSSLKYFFVYEEGEDVINNERYPIDEQGVKYQLAQTVSTFYYKVIGYTDELVERVTIPEEIGGLPVNALSGSAFKDCTGLKWISLPHNIAQRSDSKYAFDGCSLALVLNAKGHVSGAWRGANFINRLVLGDHVDTVYAEAFKECVNLTQVTFPDGLKLIGGSAFSGCTNLKYVNFPRNLSGINALAFYGCKNLESSLLLDSLQFLGDNAFANCEKIDSVIVSNKLTMSKLSSSRNPFKECTGIEYIEIHSSIFGTWFSGLPNIKDVYVGSEVETYYNGLIGCSGVETIEVDAANKVFDSRDGCNAIIRTATNELVRGCNSTVIPESVTSIAESSFSNCIGLTEINIPNSVTRLGRSAFSGCSELRSIVSYIKRPFAVTTLFDSNTLDSATLTIPYGCTKLYQKAQGWEFQTMKEMEGTYEDTTCIQFEDSLTKKACIKKWDITGDGEISIYEAGLVTSVSFEGNNSIVSFNELQYFANVTSIAPDAFRNCTGLTCITLPSNVSSIEKYAFAGCISLESISLPESLVAIGERAFLNCSSIDSIYIPDDVTAIEDYTFAGCTSLESVLLPECIVSIGDYAFSRCSNLTSISLPEGLKSIGAYAFNNTGLSALVLPSSLMSIGDYALAGSTIHCMLAEPINVGTLMWGASDVILYVPQGCEQAYKNATGWKDFIVMDENTGDTDWYEGQLVVNVKTPGQLRLNLIELDDEEILRLKICGSLNSEDIKYLVEGKGKISKLESLDLSDVTLVYDGGCYRNEGFEGIGDYGFMSETYYFYLTEESSEKHSTIPGIAPAYYHYYYGPDLAGAFKGLPYKHVVMPRSINKAAYSTFRECSNLQSVEFPAGLKTVDAQAFIGCERLMSIDLSQVDTIRESAFRGCEVLIAANMDNVKSLERAAFYNCSHLIGENEMLSLPLVDSIPSQAFYGCSSLKKVQFSNRLYYLGDAAFYRCKQLSSIDLPSTLQCLSSETFAVCSMLKEVKYSDDLLKVHYNSFDETPWQSNLPIESGVRYMGNIALCVDNISDFTSFREGTTSIADYFMASIRADFTSLTFPESLRRIGDYAFSNNNLEFLILPIGLEQIGESAFHGSQQMIKVTLNEFLKEVGNSAFGNCSQLSIVNYNAVELNAKRIFENCVSLEKVNIGAQVKKLPEGIFSGCSNLTIVKFDERTDGMPFAIGVSAFSGCSNLLKINLPATTIKIEREAFQGCTSLNSFIVPQNVKVLSEKVLSNCTALESLQLHDDIKIIGDGAFSGCYHISSFDLPEGLDSIGKNAFNSCYLLKELTIPSSVTRLGDTFVGDCYNLTKLISHIKHPKELSSIIPMSNSIIQEVFGYYYNWSAYRDIHYDNVTLTIPAGSRTHYRQAEGWKKFVNIIEDGVDVTVNKYLVTFKIGDKVIASDSLEYGAMIVAPEAPEKEGHTFNGWGEVAETVPAGDVTYEGSYAVNSYLLTYTINGDTIQSDSIAYGTAITLPEDPTKEGYTFSGWSKAPETMPANDVIINGTFTINTYRVNYVVDGVTYHTDEVTYGDPIVLTEAPTKEGYTFSGWSEAPEVMPAYDVTVRGSFIANKYLVTFKIGDEIIISDSLECGSVILVPEVPEKEGYTFNGWGKVAETVPANDLTYEGSYSVNSYLLTYTVDGETVQSDSIVYGTIIALIDEPTKEGYTFSGWSEAPETMPAGDVTISGTFTANKYLVTFKIGDEVIAADSLEYGAAIVAPEAPKREGYTFSGWGEIAAVVPANDLIYEGSYTVNSYLLTYTVDGETVQSDSIVYGAIIALIDEPTKEGHTFSGWSEAPETMPAEDLTISGTFTVNTYKVYYYVSEELVHTAEVAYGEAIPEYTYEMTGEDDVFEGWVGETYETMPAHDVTYVANITNGIEQSAISNHKSEMIFDLTGRKVTDTENLKGGVYIINGRKVVINVNDERLTKTTVIIR